MVFWDFVPGIPGRVFIYLPDCAEVMEFRSILIVLSPGMGTGDTPEEPDLTFIRGPELPEPPVRDVMVTLRAPYSTGWECWDGIIFVNDHDLFLHSGFCHPERFGIGDLFRIVTSPAMHLSGSGDHQALTFWAETHDYSICSGSLKTPPSGTREWLLPHPFSDQLTNTI
jgi:hypothetical protein